MIRTMHPYEFTRNLGLTRIIQPTVQNKAQAEEIRANRRIALAMHLYFMDMLDQRWPLPPSSRGDGRVSSPPTTPAKKEQIEKAFVPCLCTVSPCRWWKIAPRCGCVPLRPGSTAARL